LVAAQLFYLVYQIAFRDIQSIAGALAHSLPLQLLLVQLRWVLTMSQSLAELNTWATTQWAKA
jgi:hypothetical protein